VREGKPVINPTTPNLVADDPRRSGPVATSAPAPTVNKRPQATSSEVLSTSRLLDCTGSKDEWQRQSGYSIGDSSLAAAHELIDNSLDACEETVVPPEISVTLDDTGLSIQDNWPGIAPETVEAMLDFGMWTSSRAGRYAITEAVDSYRHAIQCDPGHAESYINLGNASQDLGQVTEAANYYRHVLRLKPNSVEAYNNLGNVLIESGQAGEAVNCLQAALTLAPRFAEAHCNLGRALSTLGRLTESVACYRRAVELRPRFPPRSTQTNDVACELLPGRRARVDPVSRLE
jgi:tetratricopeptide (TPR) repeat protein